MIPRLVKLTVALMIATALPAMAQGCAQCYTQAASASDRLVQALRSGIVILILPPLLISIAIAVLAYKRRNQFSCESSIGDDTNLGW
jgi:hypothetical protein